jgi:RNA polymerase sigma factor (sigma-70 family)
MDELSLKQVSEYVEQLTKEYWHPMHAYALTHHKDRTKADDIAQEVFCALYLHIRNTRKPLDRPRSWLYTVVKHHCIDASEDKEEDHDSLDRANAGSIEQDTTPLHLPDDEKYQPEVYFGIQEDIDAVTEKIHAFPDGPMKQTMMYALQGYTIKEIARYMGRPESSIRAYISRARPLLKANTPHSTNHISTNRKGK